MRSRQTILATLLIVTAFLGVSSLVFRAMIRKGLLDAASFVCDKVATDYVHSDLPQTINWVRQCREEVSHDVDRALLNAEPKTAIISIMNERLSFFRVSHLAAYAPEETIGVWTGEAVDTGARARIIDGDVVVTRLVRGSPAEVAGVHRGDIVISIDGNPVGQPEEIESQSGLWEIRRKDETLVRLPVTAAVLVDPVIPEFIGPDVLRFPTFLPESMTEERLSELRDQLGKKTRLVVDLRKNRGGSFPAMLRAASLFICDGSLLGWVSKSPVDMKRLSAKEIDEMTLEDDLSADLQLSKLEKFGAIALKVHRYDGCYRGPLVVLTDEGTASVAEIFALAMKNRPSTLVLGWSTAGKVLMAQWFSILPLGPDYTISIPVALYRSAKGEELEHRGVSPDEILRDRLIEWRSGRDPWIVDALSRIKSVSK